MHVPVVLKIRMFIITFWVDDYTCLIYLAIDMPTNNAIKIPTAAPPTAKYKVLDDSAIINMKLQ